MIRDQKCNLVWMPSLKFKSWIESSVGFFLTGNGKNKKLGGWRSALIITESSYESSSDDIYWLPGFFLQLFSPKKYRVSNIEVCKVNQLWGVEGSIFLLNYGAQWLQEVWTFVFHQPIFKKIALAGLNSLQQKGCHTLC